MYTDDNDGMLISNGACYDTPTDKRTLEFIRQNAEDPSSHSGITLASPDNEDILWLIKHFVAQNNVE